ncbi:MAG: FAD-dependent monooxygenase [Sulfitobacter sp.]
MSISNAIVVGGGIGGLAVAALMARRGVAVTVLEQAEALREVGAGLQVSPNGMAVLRSLGLETQLPTKEAVRGRAVVLRDSKIGKQVARLDLTRLRPDQPYAFLHRADLIDLLAGAAKRANVTFEMGAQVAAVRTGATPQVQLTDGSTRRAELVIAADGIHSVARTALNGPDQAHFSGQVAWRAMIDNTIGHTDEVQVHMGPGRHLVSYPLRGGRLINLVAVEERSDWAAEGWQRPGDVKALRDAFAGFGGQASLMINAVNAVTLWGLHLHPVAATWHHEGVVLLGDAAHPTLPFLAQGANLALEDAWVLADTALRDVDMAQYQATRMPRVTRVINAAEVNAWRYHLHPGMLRTCAHLGLRCASRVLPGRMLGAFDWLYGFDVTAQSTSQH